MPSAHARPYAPAITPAADPPARFYQMVHHLFSICYRCQEQMVRLLFSGYSPSF